MNESVVAVMRQAGKGINDTFKLYNAGKVTSKSALCTNGVAVVDVTGEFDYVQTMEDLSKGQRIGNYSIEYKRKGYPKWEILVPPVKASDILTTSLRDRPDGHDPRDQYVGHKRIDTPVVPTSGPNAIDITHVRFNCLGLVKSADPKEPVHLRAFSLHKKQVPWQ